MPENRGFSEQDIQWMHRNRGYLREGWLLAKAIQEGREADFIKRSRFSKLNRSTREAIRGIAEDLLQEGKYNFLEGESTPFQSDWTERDILDFAKAQKRDARARFLAIVMDKELADELDRRQHLAYRLQNMLSAPMLAAGDKAMRFSHVAPIPPLSWVTMIASAVLTTVGGIAEFYAARNDPDLMKQKQRRFKAMSTTLSGGILIGALVAMAVGGPAAAAVSAVMLALSTGVMAVREVVDFGKSIQKLYREIKRKKPKETYRWRMLKRLSSSLQRASNSVFYVSATVLAVGAVVAVFTGPFGMAAFGGVVLTMAFVTIGISIATSLVNKYAKRKIEAIEEAALEKERNEDSLEPKHELENGRELERELDHSDRLTTSAAEVREFPRDRIEQTEVQGGLLQGFKMMQAGLTKPLPLHTHSLQSVSTSRYDQLHHMNVAQIVEKKMRQVPIYRDIRYQTECVIGSDQHALVLEIPNTEKSKSSGALMDRLERFRVDNQRIEMTLSSNPSDNAIFLFVDVNAVFAPLQMHTCHDAVLALKVFEAAKLSDTTVRLSTEDRDLLSEHPNEKLREYFQFIDRLTPREFREYMMQRTEFDSAASLGQVPKDLPDNWLRIANRNSPRGLNL